MDILIALLFTLVLITLIGHGIWVLLAMIYRALSGEPESQSIPINDSSATRTRHDARCVECGTALPDDRRYCHVCGRVRSGVGPMADLEMTARQLDKFLNQGRLDVEVHKLVMGLIEEERERLIAPVRRDEITTRREAEPQSPRPAPVEPASQQSLPALIEQNVFVVGKDVERGGRNLDKIAAASNDLPEAFAELRRQPRRSFTEILETFMEESSIRWGELVGGLLIIGCSIALVVSSC